MPSRYKLHRRLQWQNPPVFKQPIFIPPSAQEILFIGTFDGSCCRHLISSLRKCGIVPIIRLMLKMLYF